MVQNEPPESTEAEHSYLDVGPTGPRRWLVAIGAFVLVLAIVATFYGLYTINRDASPTLTPGPALLTQAAAAPTADLSNPSPSPVPTLTAVSPTPLATTAITSTTPVTYAVKQGDTLIGIAQGLNVGVDGLVALNQISGETIFPEEVLLVPPTITPRPIGGPFPHIVAQGETLISIAALYDVTVDQIKAFNGLTSDIIVVGQQLQIPAGGVRPPTPTPTPQAWAPTVITGDLASAYSLMTVEGPFSLHFAPDTRAPVLNEISAVARVVATALDQSQQALQRRFSDRFAVYVSDNLFELPYTARRAFNLPDTDRLYLLYDGTGTMAERAYYTTHALTPFIAGHTLGEAATPLLQEGFAVYTASRALADQRVPGRAYLEPEQICAAYQRMGELDAVSQPLQLDGHLGYLDQHLAAGCFVGYLIETEGLAAFSDVYLSGDYLSEYGRSLEQIELEWTTNLSDAAQDLPFNPEDLVQVAGEVNEAYQRLWSDFQGTPAQFAIYAQLDRARMALLQGRVDTAGDLLERLEGPLE
jgi:LysM repeat protein